MGTSRIPEDSTIAMTGSSAAIGGTGSLFGALQPVRARALRCYARVRRMVRGSVDGDDRVPLFRRHRLQHGPTVVGSDAPGSGIFLHSWMDGPTEGCVALPENRLLDVLRWLTPSADPVIEIGTNAEVTPAPAS